MIVSRSRLAVIFLPASCNTCSTIWRLCASSYTCALWMATAAWLAKTSIVTQLVGCESVGGPVVNEHHAHSPVPHSQTPADRGSNAFLAYEVAAQQLIFVGSVFYEVVRRISHLQDVPDHGTIRQRAGSTGRRYCIWHNHPFRKLLKLFIISIKGDNIASQDLLRTLHNRAHRVTKARFNRDTGHQLRRGPGLFELRKQASLIEG